MTQPAVPSAVSYGDVREGNDSYSASGPWTHSPPAGIAPVRGRCLCQHRDGDGPRMDGMANRGERSINIVHDNKPKVLAGLSQKGTVAGPRIPPFLVMGIPRYRWTERASPIRGDGDGTGEPRTSPARESKPQGKPRGVRAWEDGKRGGHPVMGWIGVEPLATSRGEKSG